MREESFSRLESILKASPVGEVLPEIAQLGLQDAWLTAGAVRNTIWQNQFGGDLKIRDFDIVFWDDTARHDTELAAEAKLKQKFPDYTFQVRNQYKYGRWRHYQRTPFGDMDDALRSYFHTASAVAVRQGPTGAWQWLAPYGVDDLAQGILRQTPNLSPPDQAKAEQRAAGLVASCPSLRIV